MTEKPVIKKPRKFNAQSKAAQIRKLFTQGKLTPKQIGDRVDAPMPYVYVVRSKMKAEAGGLPAVAGAKIPVSGGIQGVAYESAMRAPTLMGGYQGSLLAPAQVVLEQPSFLQRMKNTVRAWLS